MFKKRAGDILLPITSLPTAYGVGDVGPAAHTFVDFLKRAGQTYWQILPLNYTAAETAYSPYNCFSAFAANPLLISPDLMYRDGLLQKIETVLEKEDLLGFLKQRVSGDLKFHHEFKVTLAECPNACSQPQIKDIGVIGAVVPKVTDEECTRCEACIEACKEKCIQLNNKMEMPEIDFECCLKCGQCISACPSKTIGTASKGFRIQLGGKLGRHPRLAIELEGLYSEDEVFEIVKRCVQFYKEHSKHGERFAEIFQHADFLKDL